MVQWKNPATTAGNTGSVPSLRRSSDKAVRQLSPSAIAPEPVTQSLGATGLSPQATEPVLCRERSPRTSTENGPALTSNKEPAQPKKRYRQAGIRFWGRGWLPWVCTGAQAFFSGSKRVCSSLWCKCSSFSSSKAQAGRHTDLWSCRCSSRMCRPASSCGTWA